MKEKAEKNIHVDNESGKNAPTNSFTLTIEQV